MSKARCTDIFIACLARVDSTQCEEILQELQIEPGTLDFSEDYGRNKNVLLAEFKRALARKGGESMSETTGIKPTIQAMIIVYQGWHGKKLDEARRIADQYLEELKLEILEEAKG